MGRDRHHVAQRAMGLDQRVQGQRLADRVALEAVVDEGDGAVQVREALGLGDHQEGQLLAAAGDDRLDVRLEGRVMEWMHAHADAAMRVERAIEQMQHQQHVLRLAADGRAVLAVQRDVEDRPHPRLQFQALDHAGLDAAVMVDDRQDDGCFAFFEEGVGRVDGRGHAARDEKERRRAGSLAEPGPTILPSKADRQSRVSIGSGTRRGTAGARGRPPEGPPKAVGVAPLTAGA